ncbi:MAG: ABC transporter permease [Magnetococcales bacterium]|nr:ABC transporter permease [Magnetococcales bacterium]
MIAAVLEEAWLAMGANRLRTFLTMLGIVIGVGAVILMLAIGEGVRFQVTQSIASMGSNLFIILSGSSTTSGMRLGSGAAATLTADDAKAIAELPDITAVAPTLPGTAQVIYGPNNWNTTVIGTTPEFLIAREWPLVAGVPFTDTDVHSATRVAIIGQTIVKNLFPDENPLGRVLRIRQSPYQVIGILSGKGQSLDGRDQDDTILVPLKTAQSQLFGTQIPGSVRFISVQVAGPAYMTTAEQAITDLLRQRHRLQEGTENDFSILNLTAAAKTAADTTRLLTMMLGAIASISLLVGGIGIMNIMLVSVTERTREIGIRMAIGARRRDILAQFLLEAVIISIVGCLTGILLGIGSGFLIVRLSGTVVLFTADSILAAFLVATGVGVFFGFYPANKGARLNPIEALRHAN